MSKANGIETLQRWVGGAAKLLWWALRWHSISTLLVVGSIVLAINDWVLMLLAWAFLACILTLWWLRNPESMNRHLLSRLRSGWRREMVYNASWESALAVCRQKEFMSLGSVRSDGYSDLVEVRVHTPPLAGWDPLLPQLAKVFESYNGRLLNEGPGKATMRFRYRDRLAVPVDPVLVPVDQLDLMRVPVGITEDGDPFCLRVQGTHTLIGGCSDSGKSGAIWSLLHSLAYAIRESIVQIWGCDPKGGMEMTKGEPLFARYVYPDIERGVADAQAYEPMVQFLEAAASLMLQRAREFREAGARKHKPSRNNPLVIIIIDELLTFTDHMPDGGNLRLRERAKNAIKILLTQGRATGVVVIGAVQDPHKDTVKMRDLFLQRLALRMTEEEQADMVLGEGARRRGAVCDRIQGYEHGVGYAKLNNEITPTRVRVSWVDDARCDWLAQHFQPRNLVVPKVEPVTLAEAPPLDAADQEALAFLRSQEVDV